MIKVLHRTDSLKNTSRPPKHCQDPCRSLNVTIITFCFMVCCAEGWHQGNPRSPKGRFYFLTSGFLTGLLTFNGFRISELFTSLGEFIQRRYCVKFLSKAFEALGSRDNSRIIGHRLRKIGSRYGRRLDGIPYPSARPNVPFQALHTIYNSTPHAASSFVRPLYACG